MELKLGKELVGICRVLGSNRTFMELKFRSEIIT